MTDWHDRVWRFNDRLGAKLPPKPTTRVSLRELLLARKLVREEVHTELEDAIDEFIVWNETKAAGHPEPDPGDEGLAEIADAVADSIVVLLGLAQRFGIDMHPVMALVLDANDAKLVEPLRYREDGKLMKPPGWKPPDVVGEIRRQRR